MKKYIDVEFEIGEVVYLKTDIDQHQRIVTAIQITASGVLYRLAFGAADTWHYDIEISTEKNVLVAV